MNPKLAVAIGRNLEAFDGDAFDAGFIAAYLEGKPPEEQLLWGNICGAQTIGAYGGLAGLPTRAELQKMLT